MNIILHSQIIKIFAILMVLFLTSCEKINISQDNNDQDTIPSFSTGSSVDDDITQYIDGDRPSEGDKYDLDHEHYNPHEYEIYYHH